MKVRFKPRLPRHLPETSGLLLEKDLKVGDHSRLHAKLLVFDTNKNLRKFWKTITHSKDLGKHTRGAVNGLWSDCTDFKDNKEVRTLECDPRYFCLIGLLKGSLSMEIICHEAVHAGFAFHIRRSRIPWPGVEDLPEEAICYPAGRIASAINRAIDKAGLYRD